MAECLNIQKSLGWCQGTPVLPGVRRRLYYLSKSAILKWPTLPRDENGRATSAELTGDFVLAADAKWKYIDHLPDKAQLTSEPQGEVPSQTQLNKLTVVHPASGPMLRPRLPISTTTTMCFWSKIWPIIGGSSAANAGKRNPPYRKIWDKGPRGRPPRPSR